MVTAPGEAISESGRVAVSCVALTNVVGSGRTVAVPPGGGGITQSTVELFTKFVPVTVRMSPGGLHAGVVEGVDDAEDNKAVIVGALMVKGAFEEAGVPGLIRSSFALPTLARSVAGTVATSAAGALCDATYVVGSVVVTLLLFIH